MILDTSAIVAILAQEPGADSYIEAISHAVACRISAANFVELSMVLEGQFGAELLRQSDALLRRISVVIEPVTVAQAHAARQAFHDFGKGRHPAALNFGDCFAYALAKLRSEPLLFKGNDFTQTDVVPAL
ncbi:MAG: type II toxin-antitoxin system VapC family toxin [Terriglobales bacterium]